MPVANGVIFQSFQWYLPPDGSLWDQLAADARQLADAGFTAVWFPPAYKGQSQYDVGYGVYDLFDLGEFDQKGTHRTKYGTRQQFLAAVMAVQAAGLQAYADVVFNHKDGADHVERVRAQIVDWNDRNQVRSDWHEIGAWTHFTFPGRGAVHSSMQWHADHFDALSFNGFRLDAVKHIRSSFFRDWMNHLRVHFGGRELFAFGEHWSSDVADLHGYISATEGVMALCDVPLHYRFRDASLSGNRYDMRTIFDGTLTGQQPAKAVTFVDNHDSQPCQSLESWVEPWFKPLAYALILLRREGYPCVFHGDYHGGQYTDKGRNVTMYSHRFLIDHFLFARRRYGFGDQHDYFDHPNTIAWLRTGDAAHPGVMAVVMTNGSAGRKWMNTFRPNARFRDRTGHVAQQVTADASGWAEFSCPDGSVSVWLQE